MRFERWLVNWGRWLGKNPDATMRFNRSDKRNPCLIASEFAHLGNVNSGLITNLNRWGAFVETRQRCSIGEVVQLKFPLHYLDPPVEVTGVIAWTGSEGVGVKFDAIEGHPLPCRKSS